MKKPKPPSAQPVRTDSPRPAKPEQGLPAAVLNQPMQAGTRAQLLALQQQTLTHHSGPLPSPEDFRTYDLVLPGAAERILKMAEADADHLRRMERRISVTDFVEGMFARLCALIFALAALAGIIYLASIGATWVAGTLAATTIGAVVGAFLLQQGVFGSKSKNGGSPQQQRR